jgi:hypothetical protein
LDEKLDFFHRQVQRLVDQVPQVENKTFRKALYISMLDALSACAYPDETKAGSRFQNFILNVSKWKDGERISLPQAALLFCDDPATSAVIAARLAKWPWGIPQPITADPFPSDLPAHVGLMKVQQVKLLWQFRNSVLHAFNDPSGHDFSGRMEPYYIGEISSRTWRLVIPEEFLNSLMTTSVQALIAFCKEEGRDPQAHLGRALWVWRLRV